MAAEERKADLSIVVPVWGSYVGRYLDEALVSLSDNGEGAEILIIDNGSMPPVPATQGARVVRSDEQLSLGAARNLGLAEARGKYVMFWDADDVLVPGIVRQLRECLTDRRVIAATAGILDADTGEQHHWPRPWTKMLIRWPRLFALVHSTSALFPTTGSTLIRTEVARAAAGFGDTDGGDDWMFGVSLALRGRIAFVAHPGRLYRRHPDSLSAGWRTVPHAVNHAARVRARIGTDPASAGIVRRALPLIAIGQLFVLFVLRPAARLRRPRAAAARRAGPMHAGAGSEPLVQPVSNHASVTARARSCEPSHD